MIERLTARIQIEHFELRTWEQPAYDTPEFAAQFPAGTTGELQSALSLFKNPKQFFEQGGHEKMKESLEQKYQHPVQAYAEKSEHILREYYIAAFLREIEQARTRAAAEVEEHFAGLLAALGMKMDVEDLAGRREDIEAHLSSAVAMVHPQ